MKNIIFMGTPSFASNVLEGLINEGFDIVAVVSQPDKYVGRKKVLTFSPVKEVALKYNIPVFQPEKIKDDYENILAFKPELIITCAYGQFIPNAIIDYPKYGCINTHGSLLPKYRGGSPVQRAIINGEKETGISLMYTTAKMDAGNIIAQRKIEIDINDTNTSLFAKLSNIAKEMLIEYLPLFDEGKISSFPQDESKVTLAYNLTKEDEYINFNDLTVNVYNRVRGLLDNPGGYAIINDKKYKFFKSSFSYDLKGKPGEVMGLYNNGFAISCIDGSLIVEMIQPEGKNIMNAKDFYNGQGRNLVGELFDGPKEN